MLLNKLSYLFVPLLSVLRYDFRWTMKTLGLVFRVRPNCEGKSHNSLAYRLQDYYVGTQSKGVFFFLNGSNGSDSERNRISIEQFQCTPSELRSGELTSLEMRIACQDNLKNKQN